MERRGFLASLGALLAGSPFIGPATAVAHASRLGLFSGGMIRRSEFGELKFGETVSESFAGKFDNAAFEARNAALIKALRSRFEPPYGSAAWFEGASA